MSLKKKEKEIKVKRTKEIINKYNKEYYHRVLKNNIEFKKKVKQYRIKNKLRQKEQHKNWKENNLEKYKFGHIKHYFKSRGIDLSWELYNELHKQKHCSICGKEQKNTKLSIDHSHKTNKIRGLLCNGCNRALGLFKDDINILQIAINYINNN